MQITTTQNFWRVIRNTRVIGKPWLLQFGHWMSPSTAGFAKGMNRRFYVQYEEFHDTRDAAEKAAPRAMENNDASN